MLHNAVVLYRRTITFRYTVSTNQSPRLRIPTFWWTVWWLARAEPFRFLLGLAIIAVQIACTISLPVLTERIFSVFADESQESGGGGDIDTLLYAVLGLFGLYLLNTELDYRLMKETPGGGSLVPTRQRVRTTARCPDPRPRQTACDQHGTPDMNAGWEKVAQRWATRVRVYSPALHQEIMAAKAAGGQLEHYRPADEYTLLKDIQACQATARGPCSAEPPRRPAAPHARPRACCPQQRHRLARKHAVRTAPQRSSWPVKR